MPEDVARAILDADQVRQAKKFIEEAGIDPETDYPIHGG